MTRWYITLCAALYVNTEAVARVNALRYLVEKHFVALLLFILILG
jgi:hypothetical protein